MSRHFGVQTSTARKKSSVRPHRGRLTTTPSGCCVRKGTSYENVAGQGVTARGSVRRPRPERIPAPVRHADQSVASGADMKPGNRKGTNPGPPDRTRRTRRTAIVLRTPPHVLNCTAVHCGPPFGTKRPQVQILSPRPCFRRSEARTRNGEGLSCCLYRNEIPPVPQQIRTLTCSSNGLPQPSAALRWDEEAAG
jgi:hypothetical protein